MSVTNALAVDSPDPCVDSSPVLLPVTCRGDPSNKQTDTPEPLLTQTGAREGRSGTSGKLHDHHQILFIPAKKNNN